jgi:hypothetical protein
VAQSWSQGAPAAFANGFRAGGHAEVRVVVVESVLAEGELVQLRQGLVTVEAEPFEVVHRHARQATAVREEVAVTAFVTAGSDSVKDGRYLVTGSDQDTTLSVRSLEMQVLETDFENDATWNTVSGSTTSGLPTSATPNPLAYMIFPPWTTAMAIPGVPLRFITASPISSTSAIADRIWP